ncbi:MAG: hypothetical protein ABSG21_11560, partial [Spirochaetia bacterium]
MLKHLQMSGVAEIELIAVLPECRSIWELKAIEGGMIAFVMPAKLESPTPEPRLESIQRFPWRGEWKYIC